MGDFYRRALSKALTDAQYRELLVSASGEISRLKAVLDSLPSGILVCDENHSLVMANKSARRLLPLAHAEGGPLWEIVQDGELAGFFRRTLEDGDSVLEREGDVAARGRNRLLSISVLPLVLRHRITGSLIFIEDITEKRSREARLRQAENLASLTTVAAGVAHEIKNPLGSISIHLQLMQKLIDKKKDGALHAADSSADSLDAHLKKYIGVLNEEVDKLNKIVVDFLFAVRPMTMDLREGNINTLLSEIIDFVRPELEQSQIHCVLEFDENVPPVFMDERYMKRALINLINNAQAAMEGGGTLTLATSFVDNELRISINDTGTGMSPEILSKIFEPYYTTKDNGTGLGLTIVYKVIKEHRGEISVASEKGRGCSFTITLPVIQKERRLITWDANDISDDIARNFEGGGTGEI